MPSAASSAAGVEAEPAHPEQRGADHGEGQVVRRHRLLAVAAALAEEERGDERRVAARHVDDETAGEVLGAEREEPAAAPDHVRERAVDHQQPDRDEGEVGTEAHALGEGADHQRGRDDREHRLEHHEHVLGDRVAGPERVGRDPGEAELGEIADEGVARPEAQRVADQDPQHADDARRHHALHEQRQHVLRADQTRVEECQSGDRHHQHERGAGQHPGRVPGVDLRRFVRRGSRTCKDQRQDEGCERDPPRIGATGRAASGQGHRGASVVRRPVRRRDVDAWQSNVRATEQLSSKWLE